MRCAVAALAACVALAASVRDACAAEASGAQKPRPTARAQEVGHPPPAAKVPAPKAASDLDAIEIEFRYRCLRSFANEDFCRCLNARRPRAVDFDAYVLFTSRSRVELGYDQLGDVDRELIESTLDARDACVRALGWE